jgi:GxxExxY protein
MEPVSIEIDRVASMIVDSALKVHRTLGPGLLESVYETCLMHKLKLRGLEVKSQVGVPIVYEGLCLESGLRLDLLVNNEVVVELKAVEQMNPVYEAQILSYLRLTGKRLGLLINFNVPVIKNGIKRFII